MRILLKGGHVLDLTGRAEFSYRAEVLVDNEVIAAVVHPSEADGIHADRVLDAREKLVMPGLVNAHTHSESNIQRGLFEALPLEVWLPQIIPVFGSPKLSVRVCYLSAMLGAIHMLKRGITTIVDHWIDSVPLSDGFAAVVQAYEESGIRALVGIDFSNVPLHHELPRLGQLLPKGLKKQLTGGPSAEEYIELCRTLVNRYGEKCRRVRAMIGFSAVPRCSDDLLRELAKLSRETGLQVHGHMLETKTQCLAAKDLYTEGVVGHLERLGLLSERLSIAHSVWVSKDEAELMGCNGVTVVHNPVSNLKLGSGVMPLRMLEAAGVRIALGTDGAASNDNLNLFEVMKFAALIHTLSTPDFSKWPTSLEILRYATLGGARVVGLESEIGSIEPGKRADITILDLRNTTHVPAGDILKHLVYCEEGGSTDTVIVNGEIVVEAGQVTRVDEQSLLAELDTVREDYSAMMRDIAETNRSLVPFLEQLYRESLQAALENTRVDS